MTRKPITIPPSPTKLRVWYRTQAEMNRSREAMHRRLGTPDSFVDDDDYETNEAGERVQKPAKARKAKKVSGKPQERRIESLTPILTTLTAQAYGGEIRHRSAMCENWNKAKKK